MTDAALALKKRGRGRPALGGKPSVSCTIRVSQDELDRADRLALAMRMDRSTLIRYALSELRELREFFRAYTDSCPKCVADEGLAHLRALADGHDCVGFALHGAPLSYPEQTGFAEAILMQIRCANGPLCETHKPKTKVQK